MELHLLVAAPRPIFCKGLYNLFVGNPNIASIEEAITGEELNRKLRDNLINFVIAHQSLITDISLLPRDQFVLLTAKPDKELFLAALQHGIRGYLLDDASEDLLKKILDIAPRACIFDLALVSWIASLFLERNELLSRVQIITFRCISNLEMQKRFPQYKWIKCSGIRLPTLTWSLSKNSFLRRLFMLTGYVREKMERFIPKPLHAYKFALMWFGRTLSTLGDNCYDIALVWLAINLTGSTILLGTVLTASYIPAILLLFLGGVWADYMGPTNILLWSDILRALATLLLALLTTLGYISIPALFLFALFYGLIAAFFDPSMGVLFASIVEPDDYNAAMSFQYMSLELAALLGPALGGWLIARYSISAAFVFDALTFVFSALAIALIRRRIRRETGGIRVSEPTEHFRFKEVFAGFHFLWREKGILAAFILFALTNGLNNTVAVLVPVLARFTLKLSAAQFGLLASCSAVGTLTAAFLLNIIGSRIRHRVFVVCGSLIAFGGTIAFMGFTQEWWQLCIAYFLFGWFFMIGEIVSSTLWLHIIPSDLRGRVFSVLSTLALSLNPVGFLFAGVLGSVYGTRVGLWIGGGAIAFLSAAALLITPVRNLDQLKPMQNESNS